MVLVGAARRVTDGRRPRRRRACVARLVAPGPSRVAVPLPSRLPATLHVEIDSDAFDPRASIRRTTASASGSVSCKSGPFAHHHPPPRPRDEGRHPDSLSRRSGDAVRDDCGLPRTIPGVDEIAIVVVDDGSADDTAKIANVARGACRESPRATRTGGCLHGGHRGRAGAWAPTSSSTPTVTISMWEKTRRNSFLP